MRNPVLFILMAAIHSACAVPVPPNCAPYQRPAPEHRTFRSASVDRCIEATAKRIADPELRKMFVACFPNTLDTTVKGEGYVITGDIDAMWQRDSAAQVWPYLRFVKDDPALAELIRAVLRRQFAAIRRDPYANAFYADEGREGEWRSDATEMKKGVHERKWEIDSLCYPLRLAHGYWKASGDGKFFDEAWRATVRTIVATFREQQRRHGQETSYRFQRKAANPTDSLGNGGCGAPVKPVGLIASGFRPSDDACTLPFLVPSNFFAADVLRKAAEILRKVNGDEKLARDCTALADEITAALAKHAVVDTPKFGKVYAYEVDGFGGRILMDDANVPSLLALPYLTEMSAQDAVYRNTRRMILSPANPYYFAGTALKGVGSPHTGFDRVWPMSVIMRAFTSDDPREVRACLKMLRDTSGGTGFLHESVNDCNPRDFTRSWFAWANTLFGELVLESVEKGYLGGAE
ncbi:MAG: glycoside hydrolase family 125 protein [Kiritimatiellia bacterium]